MSRAAVYNLLVGDTQLSALGITASTIFSVASMDTAPRTQPFVVLRWSNLNVRWNMANQRGKQNLQVWAHDHGGDYGRIVSVLDRVFDILTNASHIVGSDGYIMTQADWRGESEDLKDDGLKTITRNSAWEIVSRKQ